MGDPLRVSIVTPSFNQAAYLEQTIQSVLEQDYPDLEFIVIDGGSTDGSVEIIRKYEHRLTYWVTERDQGQADAINKGLMRVTGDVVAWLNSDDTYFPGTIRAVAAAMDAHPEVGLFFADVLAVDGQGRSLNRMCYGNYDLEDFLQFKIIGQSSVFMRRSVQVRAGGLDPTFHYLLDHHLWTRMAMLAGTMYVPEVWSAARYHSGAKNIAQAAAFGNEAYRIMDWMKTQPGLASFLARTNRQILAGAHRFDGWYLSEGGQPGPSLKSFARAFWEYPPAVSRDWIRIGGTFLELLGIHGLRQWYQHRRIRSNQSENG